MCTVYVFCCLTKAANTSISTKDGQSLNADILGSSTIIYVERESEKERGVIQMFLFVAYYYSISLYDQICF